MSDNQRRCFAEREAERASNLNRGIENFVSYLSDELRPQLEKAGFVDCAAQLSAQIDTFDAIYQPSYGGTKQADPAALRATYDEQGSALARMCGLLYRLVHQHCSFGEHFQLLNGMMENMTAFNRDVPGVYKKAGLSYHEFDSLTLELESKLGYMAPLPAGDHVEKHDRRRRMPKNPEKIEAALRECLDTARKISPLITNDKRQHTLDRIIGDVSSILSNLPEGSDEETVGRRISSLISGSAKILKVGKWIRKVDLLETEQSASIKLEILRGFEDLTELSRGQDPSARRG